MSNCSIFEEKVYKDGATFLPLAKSQTSMFKGWVRVATLFPFSDPNENVPKEIASNVMGHDIYCGASGWSGLAASLAAMAELERSCTAERRVFTRFIYPQDENGNPIYNPSGKYTVRMYVNGTWREVAIDDALPVSDKDTPLCSYIPNGELWVPLLEKACAKVKCGYENIGKEPSLDTFMMTSWIPERVNLKSLGPARVWEKIAGDTLADQKIMVVTTGLIENEETVGLKSFHSYAVFGTVEAAGKQMFLLKNTFATLAPKLRYSWEDSTNWTEELRKACSYYSYAEWGSRIFWTDIESLVENFDYLDINWNPGKLAYRKTVWDFVKVSSLADDRVNLTHAPQYTLEFQPGPADIYPSVYFYIILSKLHTKEEPLGAGETPTSLLGEDLVGVSLFFNERYMKVSSAEGALNELELTSSTQKAYKFVLPRDMLIGGRHLNLVIRTFLRSRDMFYRYWILMSRSISIISSTNFTVTRIKEIFTCSEAHTIELNETNIGEHIHGPLFFKSPQYNLKVQSPIPNAQAYLRVSYEGPRNSYNAVILSQADYNQRVLALTPELSSVIFRSL